MAARKKFKLSHSLIGLAALLIIQGALVYFFPVGTVAWLTLVASVVGSIVALTVATEVIKEVRNAAHMLSLLSVVVVEFVIFFAFEYWFLLIVSPGSFPTLAPDAVSLMLHSVMVFVFNPLYLPGNFNNRILVDACIPYDKKLAGSFPKVVDVSPELRAKLRQKFANIFS